MLKAITPAEFAANPFTAFDRNWSLISAAKPDGAANTMTASWGALGTVWNCPAATVYIRESRFTKEFVDASDRFSVSFPDGDTYRRDMALLGRVSGRDGDKLAQTSLTFADYDGVPYIAESKLVLICKKMSATPVTPDGFCSDEPTSNYDGGDYHTMYIGKVETILVEN